MFLVNLVTFGDWFSEFYQCWETEKLISVGGILYWSLNLVPHHSPGLLVLMNWHALIDCAHVSILMSVCNLTTFWVSPGATWKVFISSSMHVYHICLRCYLWSTFHHGTHTLKCSLGCSWNRRSFTVFDWNHQTNVKRGSLSTQPIKIDFFLKVVCCRGCSDYG